MMSHRARTQTVISWSGLTRDQLVTQRRRWGFEPEDRVLPVRPRERAHGEKLSRGRRLNRACVPIPEVLFSKDGAPATLPRSSCFGCGFLVFFCSVRLFSGGL